MDNTSDVAFARSRSFLSASVAGALFAALVAAGGCSNEAAGPALAYTTGGPTGSGGTQGSAVAGGPTGATGTTTGGDASSATSTTAATTTTGASNASTGTTTGTGVGGTGTGGTSAVAEACVDVEPPPDPEWPDATCVNWATETEECDAAWFADYCDVSCGRCVPESGTSTTTGSGGTGVVVEPEPEPCEDIEPPYDPEWPDATCESWALETEECDATWFAGYCDISCGRCVPEGGLPEQPGPPDCSGEGLPNVSGGDGFATRYWDCCQPHCAQFDGHRCGQDGISNTGDQNNACTGGGSFACYDEAPRAVSECLSYGHIAKSNPDCGSCYRIQFTGQGEHNANDPGSKLIAGKQMIVKVTNTGGDVAGNQFDLMVPGGGVGQFDACSRQWGTNDLGAQYGGFLTDCTGSHSEKKECVRAECMKIPEGPARDGCIWFVDWFQVADNPKFTSEPTSCPF